MSGKRIYPETLINLRHRLSGLPSRCKERRSIMQETANLYGVSESTLYRTLKEHNRFCRINLERTNSRRA